MEKSKDPVINKPLETPALDPIEVVTKEKTFDFLEAMRRILKGEKVSRLEWGDTKVYGFHDMNHLCIQKGGKHQWIVSYGDLEGKDWVRV